MKKDAMRTYSMSDADLALFSSNLVVTMTRDQTEFAAKGIVLLTIHAFETLENTFEVFFFVLKNISLQSPLKKLH